MSRKQTIATNPIPPQLLGLMDAAGAMGAKTFQLEPTSSGFRACFAAGSQAREIEFATWAGQELMTYLTANAKLKRRRQGCFAFEYRGRSYQCEVAKGTQGSEHALIVSWMEIPMDPEICVKEKTRPRLRRPESYPK